jgi:hypothetical protein
LQKKTKNNVTRWFGFVTKTFCQVVFNPDKKSGQAERSSTILSKRYKVYFFKNQRLVWQSGSFVLLTPVRNGNTEKQSYKLCLARWCYFCEHLWKMWRERD